MNIWELYGWIVGDSINRSKYFTALKIPIHSLADKMKELGWMLSCVQVTLYIGILLLCTYEYFWVLLDNFGYCWVLLDDLGYLWVGGWIWIFTGMHYFTIHKNTGPNCNAHVLVSAPISVPLHYKVCTGMPLCETSHTQIHRPQQQCTCT